MFGTIQRMRERRHLDQRAKVRDIHPEALAVIEELEAGRTAPDAAVTSLMGRFFPHTKVLRILMEDPRSADYARTAVAVVYVNRDKAWDEFSDDFVSLVPADLRTLAAAYVKVHLAQHGWSKTFVEPTNLDRAVCFITSVRTQGITEAFLALAPDWTGTLDELFEVASDFS